MKRTTLLLDDAIYADLRRRAAAEGITLTSAVERALRAGLSAPVRRGRVTLPSYDLGPFLGRDEDAAPGDSRPGGDE